MKVLGGKVVVVVQVVEAAYQVQRKAKESYQVFKTIRLIFLKGLCVMEEEEEEEEEQQSPILEVLMFSVSPSSILPLILSSPSCYCPGE